MDVSSWLPYVAMGGVLAMGWQYIRLVWSWLTSWVVVRAELSDDLAIALLVHLWDVGKCLPTNPRRFEAKHYFQRALSRCVLVPLEVPGGIGMIFFVGWRPLLVTGSLSSATNQADAVGNKTSSSQSCSVVFIRGMFQIDELLCTIVDKRNEYYHARDMAIEEKERVRHSRFVVMRSMGTRGSAGNNEASAGVATVGGEAPCEDLWSSRKCRPLGITWAELGEQPDANTRSIFDFFAYPPHVMDVVEEMKLWLRSFDWYRERRIPWRRGYVLFGPPGAGKTSFIRACGEELGIPVNLFDLASMTNSDFIRSWQLANTHAPTIVALEDFDAVFEGRRNITADQTHTQALTFDCLLNCLSGLTRCDGVILMLTSNHVDHFDSALCGVAEGENGMVTRPGRIDRTIHLDGMTAVCRRQVAHVVLSELDDGAIEDIVNQGSQDQPAQFHARCIATAQETFWQNRVEGNGRGLSGGKVSSSVV